LMPCVGGEGWLIEGVALYPGDVSVSMMADAPQPARFRLAAAAGGTEKCRAVAWGWIFE
jgi:hypothetical protein